MVTRSDLLTVTIQAPTIDRLRDLIRTHPFDFGCRALAVPTAGGGYQTPALLTRAELGLLQQEGFDVRILFDGVPNDRSGAATIGVGDRFDGGRQAPRGLGSRSADDQDLGGIMNTDEIGSAIAGLVNEYGIPTFSTPNATAEGAGGGGGLVGGINPDAYHVYFTAGVHARERGGPDNLIYFIADLLYAQKHGIGLTYGAKSYSNNDVLRALRTGIVFFPLVNPDGVRWDQATDSLWRKNRNPVSAVPGDPASIGVDINRNYDFLWDYRRAFDPSVYAVSVNLASDRPHDDTFHGVTAFSEPETRLAPRRRYAFPRIRWYMDIHSAYGEILYNWGDDDDQASDPGQNFRNPTWDFKRGIRGVQDYREWIDQTTWRSAQNVAERVSGVMHSVGGRSYTPAQASSLYATSGASDDYVFSRFQVDATRNKVYGFTMEFGYPYNFYPTITEFQQNVLDTGSGLLEFCLAASDVGLT
jgi:hypothetical protein